MAPDPLTSFTLRQLTEMMRQILQYNHNGVSFWQANKHVPQSQRARIERQILGPLVDGTLSWNIWRPDWPQEFPLYSPYAITKGEHSASMYSQVRYSGDGKKYYCHRAAYVHQHGPQSLGVDQEVSHTRFLGRRTSRNINPRHTFAEPGRYNKARHHCHLYIDVILREQYLSPRPAQEPNLTNAQIATVTHHLFNPTTMPTCDKLHHSKMCDADVRNWLRDFYDPDANSDYESQYETEDDRQDRLGEVVMHFSSDNERAYLPGQHFSSDFGPNYPRN